MDKGQEALMEGVVSAIESLGTACLEKGASFVQGASLKQTAFLEQGTSLKQAACLEHGPSHPEPERAEAFYHDLLAFFFRFLVFCMAEEGPRSDRKGRNQALLRKLRKGCRSLGARAGKNDQALCKALQAAMNQQGCCLTGDRKNQAGDRKNQAGARKKPPLFKHHSFRLSDGALLRGLTPLFFPFPDARDQPIDFSSLPPEILGVLYERLLLQRPRIVVGGRSETKAEDRPPLSPSNHAG